MSDLSSSRGDLDIVTQNAEADEMEAMLRKSYSGSDNYADTYIPPKIDIKYMERYSDDLLPLHAPKTISTIPVAQIQAILILPIALAYFYLSARKHVFAFAIVSCTFDILFVKPLVVHCKS